MTKKVLVITDAQNEFITGALGNKECEAAVKNIVAAAESGEYYKVIITKDKKCKEPKIIVMTD